jgi:predicted lipid-binding transport protein (Tim44 family)
MAFRHKTLILALAATLALGFAGDAIARVGGGFSFGSRGARTFSAPSATSMAPRGAAPVERSMTSPNENIFRRPSSSYTSGGFFSGGFGRGLLGGFIGAGLFGLLFGHGLFGGLGGGLSILGLLLQLGLLFLLFKFVMGFMRGGRPAVQGAAYGPSFGQGLGQGPGGFAGFGGGAGSAQRETELEITPADFGVFEQRLAVIETAFGAEDFDRLRAVATPEMASYFAEELATNAKQGLVNRVSDVKFLQGDLSEAWREQQSEYATVAIRFSLIDTVVDRVSGKIVSGDQAVPQQATEVWTFARRLGGAPGDWKLSAIQQA